MEPSLSEVEQRLFAAALAAMVCSHSRERDDERWGRTVARALGALVGARSSVVVLQCGRAVRAFGDGVGAGGELLRRAARPPGGLPAGPEHRTPRPAAELPTRTRAWCRAVHQRHGALTADDVTPGVCYDAVGLTAELGLPELYACAACHHRRPQSAAETRRQLELLRLLLPAFAAAARARLFAGTPHRALTRLLDAVSVGTLLCTPAGDVFYENVALTRALAADPERERLRRELTHAARAYAAAAATAAPPAAPPPAAARHLRAERGAS
ncbi:MAG: hypothetical protein ACJ79S_08380, partial [Gemmatimonadaceae bacterium]